MGGLPSVSLPSCQAQTVKQGPVSHQGWLSHPPAPMDSPPRTPPAPPPPRLGTSVCLGTRDKNGAGSYCVRQGMRLVPTECWSRQQRISPSGIWDSADS